MWRAKPVRRGSRGTPPRRSCGPAGGCPARSSARASSRRSAPRRCHARSPWPRPVQHHRQHHRHVRVDGEACRHALLRRDQLVVLAHPLPGVLGLDEREGQGPDPVAGRELDRLAPAAGHPHRRMRPLQRLGDHVARRHPEELAVPARERLLDEHARDRVDGVLPHRPLLQAVDAGSPRARPPSWIHRSRTRASRPRSGRAWRRARPRARDGSRRAGAARSRARAGCARYAPPRRRGTPLERRSASTPPGSGARPPTRSRIPRGPPARPAPVRCGAACALSARPPRGADSGARRRSRSA